MSEKMWKREEAFELCKVLSNLAYIKHYHVALTGGLLYKEGERKDCDIVFYSIRQQVGSPSSLLEFLTETLKEFEVVKIYGFVAKIKYKGKDLDAFFPEVPKTSDEEYKDI